MSARLIGSLLALLLIGPAFGQSRFFPVELQDRGKIYFELGSIQAAPSDVWYLTVQRGRTGYYACSEGGEAFVGVLIDPPLESLTTAALTSYLNSTDPQVEIVEARPVTSPIPGARVDYRSRGRSGALFATESQGLPFMLQVEGTDPDRYFSSFREGERPAPGFQPPPSPAPSVSPFERANAPAGLRAVSEQWGATPNNGEPPPQAQPWRLAASKPADSGNFQPIGVAFERVIAKRGGPPFHVLNIRVRLKNETSESIEDMSIAVYAREAQSPDWYLVTEWRELPPLQAGYRMSRDYVGQSAEIASAGFRVKVVVTTPSGRTEHEVGPAAPEDDAW